MINMSNFMGEIETPERLSDEEQKRCLTIFNETRDEYYRNLLIEHNLRLIKQVILEKFYNCDREELFSYGCEGLIKAVESFDSSKGKFSSYACLCIQSSINHYFAYNNRVGRTGDVVSLEEKVSTSFDGESLKYIDIASYSKSLEKEKDIIFWMVMDEFFTTLDDRNRTMFEMRFGLNGYSENINDYIGSLFSVSGSRVDQINKGTLRKLKEYLVSSGYVIDGFSLESKASKK